jgi:NADPH:quinone reductase-like Zn-dependent oxidoreductase
MRAIVQDRYGTDPEGVLRLAEVERPTAGDGEILVRVRAASLDRGTWHLMTGLPHLARVIGVGLRGPKAPNPGRSLAGTVDTVGRNVTGFEPGDEVYGSCAGSLAEYAVVPVGLLARKPANLSFEEASTVPISAVAALQAVRDEAQVQSGQTVLVIGASGGVGAFAAQIAKAFGAGVTGVSSTDSLELVRSLGAEHVIDYTHEDFADGTHHYDAIIDTGGHNELSRLRRSLTPRGTLVIVGSETGGRWLGGFDRTIRARLLSPFVRQKLAMLVSAENAPDLDALRELIESGAVVPVVDHAYPLDETAAAIERLVDGQARGKLVVTM